MGNKVGSTNRGNSRPDQVPKDNMLSTTKQGLLHWEVTKDCTARHEKASNREDKGSKDDVLSRSEQSQQTFRLGQMSKDNMTTTRISTTQFIYNLCTQFKHQSKKFLRCRRRMNPMGLRWDVR